MFNKILDGIMLLFAAIGLIFALIFFLNKEYAEATFFLVAVYGNYLMAVIPTKWDN